MFAPIRISINELLAGGPAYRDHLNSRGWARLAWTLASLSGLFFRPVGAKERNLIPDVPLVVWNSVLLEEAHQFLLK